MTTQNEALKAAIEESRNTTSSVKVSFDGDYAALMDAVREIARDDEVDSVELEDFVDVCGWTEETADMDVDWRLRVTLDAKDSSEDDEDAWDKEYECPRCGELVTADCAVHADWGRSCPRCGLDEHPAFAAADRLS
jgi:ribosomal protein S27AE